MNSILANLKKFDWALLTAVFLISGWSLATIYYLSADADFLNFKKQLAFFVAGFLVMAAASFFNYQIFRNQPLFLVFIYGLASMLLVLVLIFGQRIRGTTGWFSFAGINFAPVELIKLNIVLMLAKFFSQRHIELYRIRHLAISFIYVALPIFLVLLQPDLGSAFVLAVIWLGLVIVSGIKLRHLLVIMLIGLILAGAMWAGFLQDYQKKRILTFLNPQKDALGQSYNLRQSLIAIGSGKFFGKGLGKGTQSQLKFLPEAHNDFIFAVIAEEWGFLGVVGLFSLFGFLFYRILRIGFLSSNNFAKLFSFGVIIMFFVEIVINTGMNLGLLPVVGISLPFVSYGGSSALVNFLSIGILQSIRVRN
jgi:rod shape determining protein RodA